MWTTRKNLFGNFLLNWPLANELGTQSWSLYCKGASVHAQYEGTISNRYKVGSLKETDTQKDTDDNTTVNITYPQTRIPYSFSLDLCSEFWNTPSEQNSY